MKRWRDEQIIDVVREGAVANLATMLGFDDPLVPIPPTLRAVWGWNEIRPHLAISATRAGVARLVVVEGASPDELRALALESFRHNPTEPVLFAFIAPESLTVAACDHGSRGRPVVRRMTVDRREPEQVGIEQLRALSIGAVAAADLRDRAEAIQRHFAQALDQEGLARTFFLGFRDAVRSLRDQMLGGPNDDRARHDIALTIMLRLVFLYLLQRKGALDADPWFVMRRVRQARADGGDLYQSCLRPLFFGLLNTPEPLRDCAAKSFGRVPFLNGGLFEPLPSEVAHPELTWPENVWTDVFEGLLERFHFTTREHAHESSSSVDPEMLGKVFEGLMFSEDRANSGSFYTPRDVVREMVEDALGAWLCEAAALEPEQLADIREGGGSSESRERLAACVRRVRILDPAVGTGAFLLESLRVLCEWHVELTGESVDYTSMRAIIHRSLFGVDIQPTASRLCALRLWLALMTTLPEGVPVGEIPPLPNLGHRVATGNALLDDSDPNSIAVQGRRFLVESPASSAIRSQLAELHAQFLTTHGPEKVELRRQIDERERALQLALTHARVDRLRTFAEPLRRLATGLDLFGDPVSLDRDQAATLAALERQIEAGTERISQLEAGRAGANTFDFSTNFAEPMGDGGFDLILTNPPWVRTHRIDPDQRALLKARYDAADSALWPQAVALGVRAPFGTQVDLSALFLERSLELLRPGGRLAALVPAKLLRSLHGASIRSIMAAHDLERVEDFSDARESMFDATTYPALLRVRKASRRRRQTQSPVQVGVWRGDGVRRWKMPANRIAPSHPAAPWVLVEPQIRQLFEQMWSTSKPLGLLNRWKPTRGVFTGCNDVFLKPAGDFRRTLGPEVQEHVRPVLAGRDLDENGWSAHAEILWLYNEHSEVLRSAPDGLETYFQEHSDRLLDRSDHVSVLPLWQVFRVKPELLGPKVAWPDIASHLRAEVVPAGVVPLNTTYVIGCEDEREAWRVAALLNSEPVRAFAWALGERARGGFRRHFAWLVRMIPVPDGFEDWRPRDPDPRLWCDEVTELFGLSPLDANLLRAWREGDDGDYAELAS